MDETRQRKIKSMAINTNKLSLRFLLSNLFFWLFLKCYGSTNEEYFNEIYEDEKKWRKANNLPL